MTVEIGALFGKDQARATSLRDKLNGGQRDRKADVVDEHLIAVDNALVRHDVLVEGVKVVDWATLRTATACLAPANPKVDLVNVGTPLLRAAKPTCLDLRL